MTHLTKIYPIVTAVILMSIAVTSVADNGTLALRMYSSARASETGDLLTVLVKEQTSAQKDQAVSTEKAMSASATKGTLGNAAQDSAVDEFLQKIGRQLPSYDLNGSSDFAGSGSTSSSESLDANFSVRVVDVLPNSVLVIRGHRQVMIAEEKVTMVLTGLVRQRDISADNTVESTSISDATIYYETEGIVSNGTMPGWFSRLFQAVNPF